MIVANYIDQTNTMYPSEALVVSETYVLPKFSSVYGYVLEGKAVFNTTKIAQGTAFTVNSDSVKELVVTGKAVLFIRHGIKAQVSTNLVEHKGRLVYIDGCSDSMLSYPARLGDPVLNLLYFPSGIEQTFHTHPSIRLGVVISGSGTANLSGKKDIDLIPGTMFCLEEHELHRFSTSDSELRIIAYHPDSDWGPTDQNHPMLNRTYLGK